MLRMPGINLAVFLFTGDVCACAGIPNPMDKQGKQHIAFDLPKATSDATIEPGKGNLYGSVLLVPLSRATTDACVERGERDLYGSILLDDVIVSTSTRGKVAGR